MNVVIATFYGLTIWFSAIAYTIITEGPWGWVLLAGPLIVSGAAMFLMLVDWVVCKRMGPLPTRIPAKKR